MCESARGMEVPEGLAEKVIASNPAPRKHYLEIREMLGLDKKGAGAEGDGEEGDTDEV
ncbi:MAG: hypothetical protein NC548_25270 [Lachnospiraceae bacterium]|nr:hypothetical protein [Lachnospiraceae bacterium]